MIISPSPGPEGMGGRKQMIDIYGRGTRIEIRSVFDILRELKEHAQTLDEQRVTARIRIELPKEPLGKALPILGQHAVESLSVGRNCRRCAADFANSRASLQAHDRALIDLAGVDPHSRIRRSRSYAAETWMVSFSLTCGRSSGSTRCSQSRRHFQQSVFSDAAGAHGERHRR